MWANLKSWYGVLFLVLLAGGVLWSVLNGMPYINNLRANWEAKRLQAQWEKPYREDKYGGKTPEETYDMFLDALRKGDTSLASKYFVVDEQEKWLKTMEQYKTNTLLSNLAQELENTRKMWKKVTTKDPNTTSYEYQVLVKKDSEANYNGQKIMIPSGNYTNNTIFELNPYTKIWKISVL